MPKSSFALSIAAGMPSAFFPPACAIAGLPPPPPPMSGATFAMTSLASKPASTAPGVSSRQHERIATFGIAREEHDGKRDSAAALFDDVPHLAHALDDGFAQVGDDELVAVQLDCPLHEIGDAAFGRSLHATLAPCPRARRGAPASWRRARRRPGRDLEETRRLAQLLLHPRHVLVGLDARHGLEAARGSRRSRSPGRS